MNLLPQPRRIELAGGRVPVAVATVTRDARLPAQGYRLTIDARGIALVVADEAGAFYGEQTLAQLERTHDGSLPVGEIEDWPDLPVRGVMLDVSRDKVPTMETLRALIPRLAHLKLNHVELYIEHTFAYEGHDEVWADASPFTGAELDELDALCRAHHIELTPNQNCLGHMERWLRHDRYKPLAIQPDGWTDHRGRHRPPTTLDPAKAGSLELVAELIGQLTSHFSSRRMHVGLDEPWELPDERFDDYLRFIEQVRRLPELAGREVLMWGDIVASHPERLGYLPEGVTVCEWGYEANHPYGVRTSELAKSGRTFWVCPGTSSWLSLAGRWTNARTNIGAAVDCGLTDGAEGMLVTDWGDFGHLQYLPVSEPGFAWAAAQSWCRESNRATDIAAALDVHVFDDPMGELASAMLALGDACRAVVPRPGNTSGLTVNLYWPQRNVGEWLTKGMTSADLDAARDGIASAVERVGVARPRRADGASVVDELTATGGLLDLLCRDGIARLAGDGSLASVSSAQRATFASELGEVIERHRALWLARNRPGGLVDSVARLDNLRAAYLD